MVAVCLDSTFSIIDWIETSKELKALNNIIPIISDRDAKISRYGLVCFKTVSAFKKKKNQHSWLNLVGKRSARLKEFAVRK